MYAIQCSKYWQFVLVVNSSKSICIYMCSDNSKFIRGYTLYILAGPPLLDKYLLPRSKWSLIHEFDAFQECLPSVNLVYFQKLFSWSFATTKISYFPSAQRYHVSRSLMSMHKDTHFYKIKVHLFWSAPIQFEKSCSVATFHKISPHHLAKKNKGNISI